MEELRGVGQCVGEYVGDGRGDAEHGDGDVEHAFVEADGEDDTGTHVDLSDTESCEDLSVEDSGENTQPILIFYDCEATGLSIYQDSITEVAAMVFDKVNHSSVSQPSFSNLVHTPRRIPKKRYKGINM